MRDAPTRGFHRREISLSGRFDDPQHLAFGKLVPPRKQLHPLAGQVVPKNAAIAVAMALASPLRDEHAVTTPVRPDASLYALRKLRRQLALCGGECFLHSAEDVESEPKS